MLDELREVGRRFLGRRVAALGEKDAALAALFETATAGIAEIGLGPGARFLRVNGRCCEILRRRVETLLTLAPGDVVHPDDRAAVQKEWREAMALGTGRWEGELRHVGPNGETFWAHIGVSVCRRDAKGAPTRAVAVLQDVTESRLIRERLSRSEELLRLGQRIGRIGTFERDLVTGKLFCSAETRVMFGFSAEPRVVRADQWLPSFVPEHQERIAETIKAALRRRDEEIAIDCSVMRRGETTPRHLEMRARYFYDESGRPLRSVGVVIDVTERKQVEERLAHAARHDPLTGLANRTLFREALSAATARTIGGQSFAVLCLDLDRFKDVNDTLGHPAGDKLLIETAARLRRELRAGDMLARLGGDEFAILQLGLSDPAEAGRLAQRLVDCIRAPFMLEGQRVSVDASVGVAVAPRDGLDGEELLRAADLALYQAKQVSGWRFYEPEMNHDAQRRRELESDLRRAMEQGEFELFYQPVLDIDSLKVRRFEALIRWRHPTRGLVSPDRFIPFCEEAGLITPLGAWVARRACLDAARWPEDIGVSVNISAVQFADGDLDRVIAAALAESALDARRLELEITETSLLKDTETTLATLHRLKALGVGIAMDDFGAGHCSLSYLQSFPFDKVKIDRAFARGVDRSERSAAIVKAMLDLCAALGLSTTIEGVETHAQYQALARMGARKVQGYLFSPPQPVDCVPAMLEQFGGASAPLCAAE